MVLIENIFGERNKEILFNLFNFIKKVYGTENCTILSVGWSNQSFNKNSKFKKI